MSDEATTIGQLATREYVRAAIASLCDTIDLNIAELKAAMTQHVDDLDGIERAREADRREAIIARDEARHQAAIGRHAEEEAARVAFWRVTRLAEVAKYFADEDEDDSVAVERAARLIALCEAYEAKK